MKTGTSAKKIILLSIWLNLTTILTSTMIFFILPGSPVSATSLCAALPANSYESCTS